MVSSLILFTTVWRWYYAHLEGNKFREVKWLDQVHTVALFNRASSDPITLYICLFPLSSVCTDAFCGSYGQMGSNLSVFWCECGQAGRWWSVCSCGYAVFMNTDYWLWRYNMENCSVVQVRGNEQDTGVYMPRLTSCENHPLGGGPGRKTQKGARWRGGVFFFSSILFIKLFAMGRFTNFIIEIFNQKKKFVPTLQFCKLTAGEGSALFIAILLFSSAQHHVWHIMDIISVLDKCPLGNLSGPGMCLQRVSASWSPREQAQARCVSWGGGFARWWALPVQPERAPTQAEGPFCPFSITRAFSANVHVE